MSYVDISTNVLGSLHHIPVPEVPVPELPQLPAPRMQRVGAVRRQQGVSRRTFSAADECRAFRHSRAGKRNVRHDLEPTVCLAKGGPDVPLNELLVEADDSLAASILQRAQLVRLMKSALAIKESAKQESIRRMSETLIEQLLQMMPELSGVGPWHVVGKRRRLDELGVAADRRMSENVFFDLTE